MAGWESIQVELDNGQFPVISMQDEHWIDVIPDFDRNSIIRNVESVGNGKEPTSTLDEIREFIGQPFQNFIDQYVNTVTLYSNDGAENGVSIMGTDDEFYDPFDGRIEANPPPLDTPTLQFPLDYSNSIYTIITNGGLVVASFDRMGNVVHEKETGIPDQDILGYGTIRLPLSLHVQNEEIEMSPALKNSIVESRLSKIQDHLWDNRGNTYFVWNSPIPYYRENPRDRFINMETRELLDDLPEGDLVMIPRMDDNLENLQLIVETTWLTGIIGSQQNERDFGDHIVLGESNRWPLYSRKTYNYRDIIPLIPSYRSNELSTVQKSSERLMSHLYNLPLEEPDILDGYARSDLSTINRLLQEQKIARFDVNIVLQPFAGPPGTPNKVLTFLTDDRRKLFVVARYDPDQNQIFPPV